MATELKVAIVAAIAANVAIAVSKFLAAGFTGSSVMLSEGIHSLVDTGNGALILFGMRRCGGRLRLLALIEHAQVVERSLRHLGLPTDRPEPRLPPLR